MKWPRLWWSSTGDDGASLGTVSLILPVTVVEAMRAESDGGLPNETGGVLVGYADSAGRTVVTGVVGPGPQALRTPTRFRRDGEHAQAEVDRLHRDSGGRDDYVGEWHSHPASVGPSSVDRGSMAWIGGNERYRREEPVLIIMQRTQARGWLPLAYRCVRGRLVEVRWAPETDDA